MTANIKENQVVTVKDNIVREKTRALQKVILSSIRCDTTSSIECEHLRPGFLVATTLLCLPEWILWGKVLVFVLGLFFRKARHDTCGVLIFFCKQRTIKT